MTWEDTEDNASQYKGDTFVLLRQQFLTALASAEALLLRVQRMTPSARVIASVYRRREPLAHDLEPKVRLMIITAAMS